MYYVKQQLRIRVFGNYLLITQKYIMYDNSPPLIGSESGTNWSRGEWPVGLGVRD